ncbi:MAG TPA: segregation/condensation protein A [Saprospiraceae bacterium]|nr:segregation/condensation protein A [Saprospiraceae bacterium]
MMQDPNTYHIQTDHFEGPFDLLLFFIQRDEIDIYDIPISQITEDFLAYIRQIVQMNLDVASDFILMASTLMRIKAKMLLPRKELDEAGNEIDPRQDLVRQLIEYKKYKDILDEMRQLEENRAMKHPRSFASRELKMIATRAMADVEMESVSLFKLLKAFEKVMARLEKKKSHKVHTVRNYNYSLEDQKKHILGRLKPGKKVGFDKIFIEIENRIQAIVTFLAMLELLNSARIIIVLGEGTNNFWLENVA